MLINIRLGCQRCVLVAGYDRLEFIEQGGSDAELGVGVVEGGKVAVPFEDEGGVGDGDGVGVY